MTTSHWLRNLPLVPIAAAFLACSGTVAVLNSNPDGGGGLDGTVDGAGSPDGASSPDGTRLPGMDASTGDGGIGNDAPIPQNDAAGGCVAPYEASVPWDFPPNLDASAPAWASGSCGDAGCPSGTECVTVQVAGGEFPAGCAPLPCQCGGMGSCACMGSMCEYSCQDFNGRIVCTTPTASRRAVKADITYVDDEEREALARQALETRLARYRYKTEPPEARRRLGFIIDDQPDPSPAVDGDRAHVDQYGYTSMLLAAVQEQAREIEELERRLEALEAERTSSARRP